MKFSILVLIFIILSLNIVLISASICSPNVVNCNPNLPFQNPSISNQIINNGNVSYANNTNFSLFSNYTYYFQGYLPSYFYPASNPNSYISSESLFNSWYNSGNAVLTTLNGYNPSSSFCFANGTNSSGVNCQTVSSSNISTTCPSGYVMQNISNNNAQCVLLPSGGSSPFLNDSTTIYQADTSQRVLIGGATDDGTSALQVNGSAYAKQLNVNLPQIIVVPNNAQIPDNSGNYILTGSANGKPYWKNGIYYLWFYPAYDYYVINTDNTFSSASSGFICSNIETTDGDYYPLDMETGTFTISTYPIGNSLNVRGSADFNSLYIPNEAEGQNVPLFKAVNNRGQIQSGFNFLNSSGSTVGAMTYDEGSDVIGFSDGVSIGYFLINRFDGSVEFYNNAQFDGIANFAYGTTQILTDGRVLINNPTDDGTSALQVNGNVNITNGNIIDSLGTAYTGKVICYATGGTLGHCTSVVGITGSCTCVSN